MKIAQTFQFRGEIVNVHLDAIIFAGGGGRTRAAVRKLPGHSPKVLTKPAVTRPARPPARTGCAGTVFGRWVWWTPDSGRTQV